VLAAIRAGHDTRPDLAEHFGVLPNSHTLVMALYQLRDAKRITASSVFEGPILTYRDAA
jgi:hypothetical protein